MREEPGAGAKPFVTLTEMLTEIAFGERIAAQEFKADIGQALTEDAEEAAKVFRRSSQLARKTGRDKKWLKAQGFHVFPERVLSLRRSWGGHLFANSPTERIRLWAELSH